MCFCSNFDDFDNFDNEICENNSLTHYHYYIVETLLATSIKYDMKYSRNISMRVHMI